MFVAIGSLMKVSGGEVSHPFQKQGEEDIHMQYSDERTTSPAGKQHTLVALWRLCLRPTSIRP